METIHFITKKDPIPRRNSRVSTNTYESLHPYENNAINNFRKPALNDVNYKNTTRNYPIYHNSPDTNNQDLYENLKPAVRKRIKTFHKVKPPIPAP